MLKVSKAANYGQVELKGRSAPLTGTCLALDTALRYASLQLGQEKLILSKPTDSLLLRYLAPNGG
jgi:hypothetical protein